MSEIKEPKIECGERLISLKDGSIWKIKSVMKHPEYGLKVYELVSVA